MQQNIENQGFTLWTEGFGNKSDPAIILVAGAGASAFFWSQSFCMGLVEEGFFVIRYDLRDTGLSTPSQSPYTMQDLCDDVIAILDGYEIEKAHIIGHSMGGFIAQFLAAYHPDRVKSIICIASAPAAPTKLPPTSFSKAERDQMNKTSEVMLSNQPTVSFEKSLPGFLTVWRYLMGEVVLDEELATTYVKDLYDRTHHKMEPHRQHLAVIQNMMRSGGERSDFFERIKVKTLVVHGEFDYLISSQKGGETLAHEIKGAKFVLVPKMGHVFFNHQLEKQLIGIIVSFLKNE